VTSLFYPSSCKIDLLETNIKIIGIYEIRRIILPLYKYTPQRLMFPEPFAQLTKVSKALFIPYIGPTPQIFKIEFPIPIPANFTGSFK